jgi:hypothetical protein
VINLKTRKMKFAPFHILLLFLLFCSNSCKEIAKDANNSDAKQNMTTDSLPDKDLNKDHGLRPKPGTINPKQEQLDRSIKKKKKTSIIDSLKPKTA